MASQFQLTPRDEKLAIELVWQVLNQCVVEHQLEMPDDPHNPTLSEPAACFVTLYVDKQLRGCIGTTTAEKPLWQNICQYTFQSACRDYRFEPISKQELTKVSFQISVLTPFEEIDNLGEDALICKLRPNVDGLSIAHGYHKALFLPSVWESLPNPQEFIGKLKVKAGLSEDYWHRDIKLSIFQSLLISS